MHDSGRWLQSDVSRKEAFAWASLDFANSGYTTVVLTSVFNAYFVATVMASAPAATLVWTAVLSVSYLLVMVSAPILGAYADMRARKKMLLIICTVACVAATALLATVGPGMWAWAGLLLAISNLAYATHQDITAAFLPEMAKPAHLGRVSGYGWAWGYFGGLAALGASLAWVGYAQSNAMSSQEVVGGTMVITALLFAVIAVPSLRVLRERAMPMPNVADLSWRGWIAASWGRLAATWQASRSQPDLRRFLWCVAVYHSGVQTVITLAAVYAQQVMGFTMAQTILLILIVNVTAALGAWAFGSLQDRLGHFKSIALALLFWMAMVVVAWRADTEPLFWLAANFAGLAMGASQSGARAAVAYLSPQDRQAETFGLWGVAVNLSAIIGPLSYGLVSWATGEEHRIAMLATGIFFVAGLVMLVRVDFERGRRDAQSASPARMIGWPASDRQNPTVHDRSLR